MKRIIPFIMFVIYVAAVCFLCFARFGNISGVPLTIMGIPSDKVVHFCMFLPFPFLVYWMVGGRRDRMWKTVLLVLSIFLLGAFAAAATEIVQGHLTYRSSDPADFKADALALAVSSFIVALIENHKLIR